jgi:predicted dehydrogenase
MKFALIGWGNWAKNIYASFKKFEPNHTISCIVSRLPIDIDIEKRISYISINPEEYDGIIIANSSKDHARLASRFLRQNIPVFVEKPLALSLYDAEYVLNRADKTNTLLFVNYIHLYNTYWNAARTFVDKEKPQGTAFFANRDVTSEISHWDWGIHPLYLYLDVFGYPDNLKFGMISTKQIDNRTYNEVNIQLIKNGYIFDISYGNCYWLTGRKIRSFITYGKNIVHYEDNAIGVNRLEHKISTFNTPLENALLAFIRAIETNSKTNFEQILNPIKLLNWIDEKINK